jgi:hypothetical protein
MTTEYFCTGLHRALCAFTKLTFYSETEIEINNYGRVMNEQELSAHGTHASIAIIRKHGTHWNKEPKEAGRQGLTPVILATREAEIRRTANSSQGSILKIPNTQTNQSWQRASTGSSKKVLFILGKRPTLVRASFPQYHHDLG